MLSLSFISIKSKLSSKQSFLVLELQQVLIEGEREMGLEI